MTRYTPGQLAIIGGQLYQCTYPTTIKGDGSIETLNHWLLVTGVPGPAGPQGVASPTVVAAGAGAPSGISDDTLIYIDQSNHVLYARQAAGNNWKTTNLEAPPA